MNLSKKTDLAIRMLVFLADRAQTGSTSAEFAQAHDLSASHAVKIMRELRIQGWVETSPGRGSRAQLIVDPQTLKLGEVVKALESFAWAECFDPKRDTCKLSGHCKLKAQLYLARRAFLQSLDQVCIADLQTARSRELAKLG